MVCPRGNDRRQKPSARAESDDCTILAVASLQAIRSGLHSHCALRKCPPRRAIAFGPRRRAAAGPQGRYPRLAEILLEAVEEVPRSAKASRLSLHRRVAAHPPPTM
jgi:hypothetical protein